MATIVNDRDVLLQAAATRLETVTMPSNWNTNWSQVTGSGRPDDNADVTQAALVSGVTMTGGSITLSSGGHIKGGMTAYATGTGFWLGYSGGVYRLSIGDSTNFIRWSGTGLAIAGDITGTSNIDITGSAIFDGVTSVSGFLGSVQANDSRASIRGFVGYAGTIAGSSGVYGHTQSGISSGVAGISDHSTGTGVNGNDNNGGVATAGISTNAGGEGGSFSNTVGGTALQANSSGLSFYIVQGTFRWGAYTWAAPTGSTTKFMRNDGQWADLQDVLLYTGTAATAGASAGYLTVTLLDGTGPYKIEFFNP